MSLFRMLLFFLIGWFILRIVKTLLHVAKGAGERRVDSGPEEYPATQKHPDDFAHGNIQDAEFEDLTPPPGGSPKTPKSP